MTIICTTPPPAITAPCKASVPTFVPNTMKLKKSAPRVTEGKSGTVGNGTSAASAMGGQSSSTINLTIQVPATTLQTNKQRKFDLGVPARLSPVLPWTVSLIGGVARTNYTISGSTCDIHNCRGVVQRLYIFDVGAELQYRISRRVTLGFIVTKEQSLYGSVGFNF